MNRGASWDTIRSSSAPKPNTEKSFPAVLTPKPTQKIRTTNLLPDLGLNPSKNVHSLSKAIFQSKIRFSNTVGESKNSQAQVLHMKYDYDFEEFRDYGLLLWMTIMQNTSAECGKTYTKKCCTYVFCISREHSG